MMLLAGTACAFDSGSNGSYGPLVATNAPIVLPPDGIIHCTTIDIPTNQTLRFVRNARNTPVYLLATGDVNITGAINVEGQENVGKRGGAGGPGGFDGGQGGQNPGDGFGPGGGKGGWVDSSAPTGTTIRGGGGYGTAGTRAVSGGATYGNSLLIPMVGGSGGGGGTHTSAGAQYGGGGGGGAILIASNTKINYVWNGNYTSARGGPASSGYGGGSGGSIRLVAPIISGNAGLDISGTMEGGVGRVRIDGTSVSLNLLGTDAASYTTFGSNMVVFPPNMPEIRIVQAAGKAVPLSQVEPVFVLLPAGSPATQTIQVQLKNFNGVVPLAATVTPESGQKTTYNFEVNNPAGATNSGSVDVQIPAGVSTRVDVWTR